MTRDQAGDILQHLLAQMERFGYGDVVREVRTKLMENYSEQQSFDDERYLLRYYLQETIETLSNISNDNFSLLLNKFNTHLSKSEISFIEVQFGNDKASEAQDLRHLPSYRPLIGELQNISDELNIQSWE